MAHIVFVECNRPGLKGLKTAKALGHRVTFVRNPDPAHQALYATADRDEILQALDCVVDVSDTGNAEILTETLAKLNQIEAIDAIICFQEWATRATANAAAALNLRFTSLKGMLNARDKVSTRECLAAAGIPSVRHRSVRTYAECRAAVDELGMPVIVKPAHGLGKLATAIIADFGDLEKFWSESLSPFEALSEAEKAAISGPMVVEEYIRGTLFSVEIGIDATGAIIPYMLTQRRRGNTLHNEVLELGSIMPSPVSDKAYAEIISYTEQVLRALKLDLGIFHVELIVGKDGPRLVEVNPRLMGGALPELYAEATGDNIYRHLIAIHLGETSEAAPKPKQYAVSRVVAAREASRVRENLPASWDRDIVAMTAWRSLPVRPGQQLPGMVNNYTSFGYLITTGASAEDALERSDEAMTLISQTLGVDLMA